MNRNQYVRAITVLVLGLTSLVLPVAAEQPTKIDFSGETVGAEPKSLVAVVGIWRIESEGGKNVLAPTRREPSTASAMPNFSIGFRLTPTILTPSPRTSRIFGAVRSPCASRACPAASIREPAYCSI
jgi:hypothetical protein